MAYLTSAYPAVSHAFIEREVAALRELGMRVETFSVRPAQVGAQLSAASRAEAEATTALLGQRVQTYPRAALALLRERPAALLRGLRSAWSNGPWSVRSKVWQHFYLAEALVLLQHLRARGLHHVHVHFANSGADVARLAVAMGEAIDGPGAGWRWTLSMHGPTEFQDPEGHDLAAKVRSAEAVACISEHCREQLRSLVEAEHWAKLHLVRMGADVARFPPAADERAERGSGPLRVLFVGRLVPDKTPQVLVEAAQRLDAAGRELEVVIVGDGVLREELAAQVRAARLEGTVRMLGAVGQDDLPGWYAWADVFCLPSAAEGVPVVLMEAMSTELPVVTTRIAGIPELVLDEETGLLVEPGDAAAVAAALERLTADPALRDRMGRRARHRVVEEFQPGPNARRLLEVFASSSPSRRVPVSAGDPT